MASDSTPIDESPTGSMPLKRFSALARSSLERLRDTETPDVESLVGVPFNRSGEILGRKGAKKALKGGKRLPPERSAKGRLWSRRATSTG